MTNEEKYAHLGGAAAALEHEMVREVMQEYAGNMGFKLEGLPAYGLRKVARYAATIAWCAAKGIDINELRATPEEYNEHALRLAQIAMKAGKGVILTDGETVQCMEPDAEHPQRRAER